MSAAATRARSVDTILVVEDERDLAATLEYSLDKDGYRAVLAYDGQSGLEAARASKPSLILLDLMLPDMSGTEVCRELKSHRETADIPVVIITAKGEEIDRVVGFELGADDYVVKPFSVRELLLRVRAILRRSQTPTPVESGELVYGPLKVDSDGHQAWLDGVELTLTALEFKLLAVLVARKGRVQSRKQLLEDVWGVHGDLATRTVDSHVKRLRQKLGRIGDSIETLRGVGYRFAAEPKVANA